MSSSTQASTSRIIMTMPQSLCGLLELLFCGVRIKVVYFECKKYKGVVELVFKGYEMRW